MPVHSLDLAVIELARKQHGLIHLSQLAELGGTRSMAVRRVAAGHWERVAPAVYAVGAAPATMQRRITSALLSAGPGAVASHRTAAGLWEIGAGRGYAVEISIPRPRRHSQRGVIVHRSRDLDRAGITQIAGIPVTGLARTLLDLGAVAPRRVRRAVQAARRNHGLGWDDLLQVMVEHSRRGRRGVGPLRAVVSAHYGEVAADSALEDLAFEILVHSGKVPVPVKQMPVLCADGVTVSVDLGWPAYKVGIELYGVDHLTNEDVQHLDAHRENQITLAGYRLLVYTGTLLRRQPDQFVVDALALLRERGYRHDLP